MQTLTPSITLALRLQSMRKLVVVLAGAAAWQG